MISIAVSNTNEYLFKLIENWKVIQTIADDLKVGTARILLEDISEDTEFVKKIRTNKHLIDAVNEEKFEGVSIVAIPDDCTDWIVVPPTRMYEMEKVIYVEKGEIKIV